MAKEFHPSGKTLSQKLYGMHLITALCGFGATVSSYILFDEQIDYFLAILIGFATLLDYHLQNNKSGSIKEAWKYYIKNNILLFLFAWVIVVCLLLKSNFYQFIFMGHLALVAVFYGYDLKLGKFKLGALRYNNNIKIFLIVYVWVAATVWYPFLETNFKHEVSRSLLVPETIQRALFYFALTLPFDIRDEESDKRVKLKTLAATIGLKKTQFLSTLCLIFSSIVAYYAYHLAYFLAISVSHIFCFFIILGVNKKRKGFYYTGLMDGSIVFQAILLLIAYYFG
ncbi:hypothetical protein [Chondrinema litorale]|uniref:hypothetical protein n=1 Tax=Chondrinema litorale TaxID=2994555 RepID=UPI00254370FC|nr:hypothetical protein [Chondrinema litorale]UZR94526.1 hypothetical protein OQ292_01665 [Chondrinema litorale]